MCAIYIILMGLPCWAGLVVYYLVFNDDLASLTLIERNWIESIGRPTWAWIIRSAHLGVDHSVVPAAGAEPWY